MVWKIKWNKRKTFVIIFGVFEDNQLQSNFMSCVVLFFFLNNNKQEHFVLLEIVVYCVHREGGKEGACISSSWDSSPPRLSRDRPNAGKSLIAGSWRPVESPSAYRLKYCGTPHANLSFPSFSSLSPCPLILESAWKDGRWAGHLQSWHGGSLLEDAGWQHACPFPVVVVVVGAMPTNKMAMLAMQDSTYKALSYLQSTRMPVVPFGRLHCPSPFPTHFLNVQPAVCYPSSLGLHT